MNMMMECQTGQVHLEMVVHAEVLTAWEEMTAHQMEAESLIVSPEERQNKITWIENGDFKVNLLTPRVKPWVIQSSLTFDSMDRTHSLESFTVVLFIFQF